MRIARVVHQHRRGLAVGLIGMMAVTAGCGDSIYTEPTAAPPVQQPGTSPPPVSFETKGGANSPGARAKAEKLDKNLAL
jgi:hypothetical protein